MYLLPVILSISITSSISHIIRTTIQPSWLLLSFITTFEFLANCLELGIVLQFTGFFNYASFLLVILNYWSWSFRTPVSPHIHLYNALSSKSKAGEACAKMLAQLGAGLLVWSYAKGVWALSSTLPGSQLHKDKLQAFQEFGCSSMLKVGLGEGILFEGAATFLIASSNVLLKGSQLEMVAMPSIIIFVKYLVISSTGAFMNPLLASVAQINCVGVVGWEGLARHLFVYWAGPLLGFAFHEFLKGRIVQRVQQKQDLKEKGVKKKSGIEKKTN